MLLKARFICTFLCEEYLRSDSARAIDLDTHTLANQLRRIHKVLEHSVVDSLQRAADGSGLLEHLATAGLRQDTALGNDHNVAIRELLLQLTRESILRLCFVVSCACADDDTYFRCMLFYRYLC